MSSIKDPEVGPLSIELTNPAKKLYEREGFEFGEPRCWYMIKELPA